MQKKLMIIAVLLLAICNKIAAADQVTISEFSIFTGQTKDVSISLTNDKAYAAFQFDLVLPEGVTVVMPESPDTWNDHKSDRIPSTTDLSMQQLSDGSYRFVAMPGTTTIENISGSEGVIINLTLSAAAIAAVGNQTGYFRNIKLSTSDGVAANGNTISEQSFTFTARGDEAYAVLSEENTKLTFYYDKLKDTRENSFELEDKGWLYYQYKLTMTTVVFDGSFADYTGLTSTAGWFEDCQRLTEINGLSNLKTPNVTDMSSMFKSCNGLSSLIFSGFNTAKVKNMSYMFDACSGLTHLDISSFNTESVEDMSFMFNNCTALEELSVSNFRTSNVKNMESMFSYCAALTTLDVTNFNTPNVENMAGMFIHCSKLASIDVTHFTTDNVTNMKQMFQECNTLTTLNLGSFNTNKVESMKMMFYNCNALTTVYVGENWSITSVTDDGEQMLDCCTSLVGGLGTAYNTQNPTDLTYAHIDGGSTNPGYFTDVQYIDAVAEPYALVTGDDEKTLTFYYDNRKGARHGYDVGPFQETSRRWDYYGEQVTSVVFDDSFADCNTITSTAYWFSGFKKLTSIEGLENLKTESVTDMSYMFYCCSVLPSLDLRTFNTSKVTNMLGMFHSCGELTSVDLSSFDASNVTNMGDMFHEDNKLETIIFPDNLNTAKVTNMSRMFYNCQELTTLNLKGFDTGLVEDFAMMFYGCSSLANIDVSRFNAESATRTTSMFYECSSVTMLDLGNFSTPNVTDMNGMFQSASSLKTIYVDPDKWVSANGPIMFLDCASLVGGEGTAYNASEVGSGYARIDDPANGKPGYFTDVAELGKEPYAKLSEDESGNWTLTFYYDDNKTANNGMSVGPFSKAEDAGWYSMRENINEVTFENSFAGCTNLTSTAYWFYGFKNLTSIYGHDNLNTASVNTMQAMFYGCEKIEHLYLSSYNTANVTNMSSMFNSASGLITILVGDGWSTTKVNKSSEMFKNCTSLVGVEGTTYDDGHTDAAYAHIDGGADYLGYLTGLTCELKVTVVGNGQVKAGTTVIESNTEKTLVVETGESMALTITPAEGYKLLSFAVDMIDYTQEIESRIENEEDIAINIDRYHSIIVTFVNDTSVPYAVLSNENTTLTFYYDKKKEEREGMSVGPFTDPSDLTWLNVTNSIKEVVFDDSFAECTTLTSTAYWFYGASNLTTVTGINNLKTDNVSNMSHMFYGCNQGLTDLDLSGLNAENVKDMSLMFYGCSLLKHLDMSGFKTKEVTNMNQMFYGCTMLELLDLSDFNTAKVTDMGQLFYGCGLKGVFVGGDWSCASVTVDDEMFSGCTGLEGGLGTTYDLNHIDKTYAHIDGGVDNPGYFSDKNSPIPYAVLNNEETVLTFFYDNQKYVKEGMRVGTSDGISGLEAHDPGQITNVIFDDSFADCTTLKSTAFWFYGCTNLATITGIGNLKTENVTSMQSMFESCTSLTELDLTGFNTSKVTNMSRMFWGCSSLESLDLSGFDVSSVLDMSSMFFDCRGLTSLNLGGWTTPEVTTMNSMFMKCSGLTDLDLGSFNTASVTDMYHMFAHSYNLKTIYVGSGWTTSKVENGTEMFYGCSELVGGEGTLYSLAYTNYDYAVIDGGATAPGYLTNVKYKGVEDEPYAVMTDNEDEITTDEGTVQGKTLTFYYDKKKEEREGELVDINDLMKNENVDKGAITIAAFDKSFGGYQIVSTNMLFSECSNLTTIKGIEYLKTEKVRSWWGMFYNCSSLTELDVSGFNTENAQDMSYMFANCSSLTELDVSKFNTEKVTDMSYMFYNCISLTDLDVSGFKTENVKDMNSMFSSCSGLTSLDVSGFDTGNVTNMDEMFFNCTSLTDLDVRGFKTGNVTTMKDMFGRCSGLTSLDLNGFNTEKVTDMSLMFENCLNLTSLDVSTFNTGNVTNMKAMFFHCPSLTNLDVSGFNTKKVTNMNQMFYNCSSLTELGVSRFETDNVTNMYYMFYNCSGLTKLDVSGFNTGKVENMTRMFFGCSNLTHLDVSHFDTGNVYAMSGMFDNCASLTKLDVSGFNTENVTTMSEMFMNCSSLTSLDISSFKTDRLKQIDYMFYNNPKLTSIIASDKWVTDHVEYSDSAFYGCTALVGSLGTTYHADHIDGSYARIDGGANAPGYFTDINAPASYEVKVRAVGNGQVTIDRVVVSSNNEEIVTVDRGSAITMVFTPDEGNKLESVVVDNTDVTSELEAYNETGAKIYTLDRIYDYHKVTATFANNTVTLTAKSYTRKYGEENPEFEYTAEGADFSGKPTITCEATDTTSVGTYPIVITYTERATTRAAINDINANESSGVKVVCVNGTLTITKAPLTITAKNDTIKRGQDLPTFEVEYSGFKNNETDTALTKKPTITCVATSDSLAGTYPIVVSGGEAKNYELKYVNGTLTITDDVAVTAKSYTRVYGDANPTFEFTSDGATLSGTPSITCAATATSPVGTYDIVIAKGDVTNSEVTFVNGTLTITKAPLTITAKSYTIKQGKDLPTLELEYSGLKNNETDTVFTTKPVVSTTATKYSEPGSYDITVKDAEAANYEITFVKGTLTITKKTETYDGSSNVLTVEEGGNIDDALENIGGRDEVAKSIAAIIWNSSIALTSDMLKGFDNPNMLIYVASKDQAPEGRDNVVIDGVASYIRLTDSDTGNNNFYTPKEFTADSIAYTREFKQETRKNVSRGWEGICLPFTVQSFTHESHGEIVPFGNSASKYHFWLHQFTEDGIVNAETIEANKPYLISMPNSNEYYEEFNQAGVIKFASANVKVPVTEAYTILIGDTAQIVPTFQEIDASEYIYALNVSDSILTNPEGSIFVSNYRKVRPFEIYTFHEPSHKDRYGSRIISLSSLYGGNDTTGIDDVMIAPNSDVWYDLSGRRLQSKPSKGGLYIHNGRKIVIK